MKHENWNEETQFVCPKYAESVQGTRQCDDYSLGELFSLAHYMSTDGNYADHECVMGYKECLTPEGWVAFLAALTNACAIEEVNPRFEPWNYPTNLEKSFNWLAIRKHLLGMQCHGELYDKLVKEV